MIRVEIFGGLIGFYASAACAGITGLVNLMMLGGVRCTASGIGSRSVMTVISGNWSNWQNDIFNPRQILTDFGFGAVGGAIGYGAAKYINNSVNKVRSKPDFYGTLSGELIPSTKQGRENNLKLLQQKNNKFDVVDSYGPIRIRLDLDGHPVTPGFMGIPDPLHEIPHIHIERKLKIISGPWISTIKLPWDFFD